MRGHQAVINSPPVLRDEYEAWAVTCSPRMVMYFHQVVDVQIIIPKVDALSIRYIYWEYHAYKCCMWLCWLWGCLQAPNMYTEAALNINIRPSSVPIYLSNFLKCRLCIAQFFMWDAVCLYFAVSSLASYDPFPCNPAAISPLGHACPILRCHAGSPSAMLSD